METKLFIRRDLPDLSTIYTVRTYQDDDNFTSGPCTRLEYLTGELERISETYHTLDDSEGELLTADLFFELLNVATGLRAIIDESETNESGGES